MIHEMYGKLAEERALLIEALANKNAEYEQECANHRQTVALLGQVVSGEIALDRVTVEGSSWRVAPVLQIAPPDDDDHPHVQSAHGR